MGFKYNFRNCPEILFTKGCVSFGKRRRNRDGNIRKAKDT